MLEKYLFGTLREEDFSHADDAAKLWLTRLKAILTQEDDFFRMTVIFEAICAALAASFFVWGRVQQAGVAGMSGDECLEIIAPVFDAVGIDVKKIIKYAFKAPDETKAKGSRKYPPNLEPLYDHFRARRSEKEKRLRNRRDRLTK